MIQKLVPNTSTIYILLQNFEILRESLVPKPFLARKSCLARGGKIMIRVHFRFHFMYSFPILIAQKIPQSSRELCTQWRKFSKTKFPQKRDQAWLHAPAASFFVERETCSEISIFATFISDSSFLIHAVLLCTTLIVKYTCSWQCERTRLFSTINLRANACFVWMFIKIEAKVDMNRLFCI